MDKQQKDSFVLDEDQLINKPSPVAPDQNFIEQIYAQYFDFFKDLDLEKYRPINENPKEGFQTLEKTNNQTKIQSILKLIRAECIIMLLKNQFKVDDQPESIQSSQFLYYAPFEITLVKNMITWQVVELYCRLGPFSKKFIVLNCPETISYCNHLYYDLPFYEGSWGTKTIIIHQDNTTYAQKRIPFLWQKQKIHQSNFKAGKPTFMKVLRQFFIASLMSAIQVGPYLTKMNGFDLNISEGFIEFNMEVCQKAHRSNFKNDLKLNLLKMHCLKICHSDIAPKNIMFSPLKQKSIFIDFGISNMVKQQIHQNTYTSFCGTYGYTIPELSELVGTKIHGYVNMYSNDIYGLKKSYIQLKEQQEKKKQQTYINEKAQNLTLYDNYRKICSQCKLRIAQNAPSDNIFGYTNPKMDKHYQYKILVQRCKFSIYCRNIYFQCAKNTYSQNQDSEKKFKLQQIEGVPIYCHQLSIFNKAFDQFYPYQNLIKEYEDFYFLSKQPGMSVDIQDQIVKWKLFYQYFDPTNRINLNGLIHTNQETFDQTLKDLQNPIILNSVISSKDNIFNYFFKLIFISDFTSNNQSLTNNIKKKILKTYCSIRKQILTEIDPCLFYHDCGNNPETTSYFPNHLYQSIYDIEIIQFYDDLLKLALYQNYSIQDKNIKFQLKTLIFQLGFKILKNFILLGFNYFYFIKDYIKNCMKFIMKSPKLQNHLILIMTREIIELGFFLDNCVLIVDKDKNKDKLSKNYILNEDILIFEFEQQDESLRQYVLTNNQILVNVQKLWIFLNPQYAKFKFTSKQLFLSIQAILIQLKTQFKLLKIKQKVQLIRIYEQMLSMIRNYHVANFFRVNSDKLIKKLYPGNFLKLDQLYENLLYDFSDKQNVHYAKFFCSKKFDFKFFIRLKYGIKNLVSQKEINSVAQSINLVDDSKNIKFLIFFQLYFQKAIIQHDNVILDQLKNMTNCQKYDRCYMLDFLVRITKHYSSIILIPQNLFLNFMFIEKSYTIFMSYIVALLEQNENWRQRNVELFEFYYIKFSTLLLTIFQNLFWRFFNIDKVFYKDLQAFNPRRIWKKKQQENMVIFYKQMKNALGLFQMKNKQNKKINLLNLHLEIEMKLIMIEMGLKIDNFGIGEYFQQINKVMQYVCETIASSENGSNRHQSEYTDSQIWPLILQKIIGSYQFIFSYEMTLLFQSMSFQLILEKKNHLLSTELQIFIQKLQQVDKLSQNPLIQNSKTIKLNSSTNLLIYVLKYIYWFNMIPHLKDKQVEPCRQRQYQQIAMYLINQAVDDLSKFVVIFVLDELIKLKVFPLFFSIFICLKILQKSQAFWSINFKFHRSINLKLFKQIQLNAHKIRKKNQFLIQLYVHHALIHRIKWGGSDVIIDYPGSSQYNFQKWPIKNIRNIIKLYPYLNFLFSFQSALCISMSWIISKPFKFCEQRKNNSSRLKERANLLLLKKKYNLLGLKIPITYLKFKDQNGLCNDLQQKLTQRFKHTIVQSLFFCQFKMRYSRTFIMEQEQQTKPKQMANEFILEKTKIRTTLKIRKSHKKIIKYFKISPKMRIILTSNKISQKINSFKKINLAIERLCFTCQNALMNNLTK